MTTPDQRAALEPLLRDPANTGIFTDFDGTLSEIVDDPAAACPVAGVVDALESLSAVFGRVGVLSGRPVAFLEQYLDGGVLLAGLYGLETVVDGVRRDHPQGGAWREVIDDVAASAVATGPPGMQVEPKGLSLTLHFRTAPGLADEVQAWAEQQAARSGLEVRPARMSWELHPPIKADKGTAIEALAGDLSALCFIGDDVGDLPAFDALDRLEAGGRSVVRIAVHSNEESPVLIDRADLAVAGPAGARDVLRELLFRVQPTAS